MSVAEFDHKFNNDTNNDNSNNNSSNNNNNTFTDPQVGLPLVVTDPHVCRELPALLEFRLHHATVQSCAYAAF